MNKQIIASLILATLTSSAFALPGNEQQPLTEQRSSSATADALGLGTAHLDRQPAPHKQQLARGQKPRVHKPRA